MSDSIVVPEATGLSEVERVVDAFIAPSKTFNDILRSASWWLPFVVMVIFSIAMGYAVDKKVGFDAVAQQQMTKSPAAADRFEQMPPDAKAKALSITTMSTRISTYASGVIILIVVALHALLLWAGFNFGLGAKTKYPQVFAVIMYAGLPKLFIWLLSIILLFAGVGLENYDIQNPVGTNVGYFLPSTMPALKVAGSFIDVFDLWALALLVIGMAIISKKKIGSSAAIVVGLWALVMLALTGVTAAFS